MSSMSKRMIDFYSGIGLNLDCSISNFYFECNCHCRIYLLIYVDVNSNLKVSCSLDEKVEQSSKEEQVAYIHMNKLVLHTGTEKFKMSVLGQNDEEFSSEDPSTFE